MSKLIKAVYETAQDLNSVASSEHLRNLIDLLEEKNKHRLELTPLPVKSSDLAPVFSEQSIKYHYDVLARGYVDRFNSAEGDPEFNQAGAYLHNVFFTQFQTPKSANKPQGAIAALIDEKFGSYVDFQKEFEIAAMKIQGSGWIYLSRSGVIKTIQNHRIRRDIALLVDWWEHAFFTDYGPNKKKYLANFWKIVDWNVVNSRL